MAYSAFAVAAPGLETLTAGELRSLGVTTALPETGGVAFDITERALADVLLNTRTATRIILRIAEFRVTGFAQLEKRAKAIPWASWLPDGGIARFRVTCRKSRLYHSDAVAERLAGALTASVRGAIVVESGDDDGEAHDAAQLFVVRIAHDVCTISVDAAGAPLYKRGYRTAVAKAPIRETMAAAMLAGVAYQGDVAVHDPFCGAGTLPIEAALIARRIAPGINREFAAEKWPGAKQTLWRDARAKASEAAIARAPVPISGADRDAGAIASATANAERAGVANDVVFEIQPVSDAQARAPLGLLIANPPYGVRVGDHDLRNLYARFGDVARVNFPNWRCAVLFGDGATGRVLEREFGIPLDMVWRSMNGGIPIRLMAGDVPAVR